MKNNKLKKLGKFFAKGAKVGLMSTMLATTACVNILDIDELRKGGNGTIENNIDDKYGVSSNFEIDQDGMLTQLFGRHRFAPVDATFEGLSHDEIGDFGWRLYKHSAKYLTERLAEFNYYMQEIGTNEKFRNLAQKMEDNNAFKKDVLTIDQAITRNLNDCAELFANMINPLEVRERNKFMACYDYLANRAYNASLGQKAGMMPRANRDLAETKQTLEELGITAKDFDVQSTLYYLLDEIKEKTGVPLKVLHLGVNVALCSDGMRGARDLGGSAEALNKTRTYIEPGTFKSKLGEWSRIDFDNAVSWELHQLWEVEQEPTMVR